MAGTITLGVLRVSITRLRDNQTIEFDYPWTVHADMPPDKEWEDTAEYLWGSGNYHCNCNRFLFFERALGKTEEEIKILDPNKGDMGRCDLYEQYRVDFVRNKETGKLIYKEPR